MIFERIKANGLAHNSYFIGSGNIAVVIDPKRDIQDYLDLAFEHKMKIKYIFETHRNEDYVIGSLELAEAAHGDIFHGPGLDWNYGTDLVDGQEFQVGKLSLKAIFTPGHTDESVSYVLNDLKFGKVPVMIFSGDTLFVGDTGRVDLYGPTEIQRLADNLFDSLFKKILPLGDSIILCPAHGAGSVCGLNIADRDQSTLGIERVKNPILQFKDRESFTKYKAGEHHERPPYFSTMEQYNKNGAPGPFNKEKPGLLTSAEFKFEMEKGALVIDTSLPLAFGGAHIKGAYSIWLDGLAVFPGWLVPCDNPLLLVLEDQNHLEKAITYLSRIGYDRVRGFLKDGVEGWIDAGYPVEKLPLLSIHQLREKVDQGEDLLLLDVRGEDEWKTGHLKGALNIYIGHLQERTSEIPRNKKIVAFCSVGHRASIASSILLRSGFSEVYNAVGGMLAWRNAGFPILTG
jgi:hydroxyacylglutathione hydrolase